MLIDWDDFNSVRWVDYECVHESFLCPFCVFSRSEIFKHPLGTIFFPSFENCISEFSRIEFEKNLSVIFYRLFGVCVTLELHTTSVLSKQNVTSCSKQITSQNYSRKILSCVGFFCKKRYPLFSSELSIKRNRCNSFSLEKN